MRLVCAIVCAALFVPAPAKGASAVTLVLQFDEAYSPKSLDAMEREVASIVSDSGLKVDWRLLGDVHPAETFERLLVIRFRGGCLMEPHRILMDEAGASYAFTHISDGEVLPFSEVECDKVTSSIRPAISKARWEDRDSILGRALGRVLAHELYHMVTKTRLHAANGVTRSALSPAQLVSSDLRMSMADLENLHQATASEK